MMAMTRKRRRYYVPEEIQRKILLRLRVKSLIRFCSINKSLQHLISTQQFINDHLKTIRCEEDALILLHQGRRSQLLCCLFLDGPIPKHIEDIRLPYETLKYCHVRTVGYCNGIACLIRHSHRRWTCEVLFLNPSIRKVVVIPASQLMSRDISSLSFGFGYVEDDYKLVVLPCTFASGKPLTAKVFSLKTRNWATVACSWSQPHPKHLYWKIALERPVFLDGACHWLAKEIGENGRLTKIVVSFYLSGDHTISKMVLPGFYYDYYGVSIHVYDGRLSLIVSGRGLHEVRVMNKCGVFTYWTIVDRMDGLFLPGTETGRSTNIAGFSGGGGVVYGWQFQEEAGWICEELVCDNPFEYGSRSLKRERASGILSLDRLYAYRQNLVLLDQDVQIP